MKTRGKDSPRAKSRDKYLVCMNDVALPPLMPAQQVCDMMVADDTLIETGVSILYHVFIFR